MNRTCITCKKCKDEAEFFFRNKTRGYRQSRCKECFVPINNNYKKRNPEKLRIIKRREYLKNRDTYRNNFYRKYYGIDLEFYNFLLNLQKGVCSICGNPPKKRPLDVDHCHSTGKVRGLLCSACNRMLSNCYDNPKILMRGAVYLIESKQAT